MSGYFAGDHRAGRHQQCEQDLHSQQPQLGRFDLYWRGKINCSDPQIFPLLLAIMSRLGCFV